MRDDTQRRPRLARSRRAKVVPVILAVVLLACPAADVCAQAYDQFIIGVWQPGGWAGGQSAHRDISFTSVDRDSLEHLGIDLLINTPYDTHWTDVADTSQAFEKRLMAAWAQADSAGYVVQWAPVSTHALSRADKDGHDSWTLQDYAGCARVQPGNTVHGSTVPLN